MSQVKSVQYNINTLFYIMYILCNKMSLFGTVLTCALQASEIWQSLEMKDSGLPYIVHRCIPDSIATNIYITT